MAIFRRRADSGEVTEQIARLGRQIDFFNESAGNAGPCRGGPARRHGCGDRVEPSEGAAAAVDFDRCGEPLFGRPLVPLTRCSRGRNRIRSHGQP